MSNYSIHRGCQEMIADSRADLECARLLTLSCAAAIDNLGPAKARDQIALIKYAVPEFAFRIIDRAVQVRISVKIQWNSYFIKMFTYYIFCSGSRRSRSLPRFSFGACIDWHENFTNCRWTRCSPQKNCS